VMQFGTQLFGALDGYGYFAHIVRCQ
jgi:hypothetical protein